MWGLVLFLLFLVATVLSSFVINTLFGHKSYWRGGGGYQKQHRGIFGYETAHGEALLVPLDAPPSSAPVASSSPATATACDSIGPSGANGATADAGGGLLQLSPTAAARYFVDQSLPVHLVGSELMSYLTPHEVTRLAQVNRFFRRATSLETPYWALALARLPPLPSSSQQHHDFEEEDEGGNGSSCSKGGGVGRRVVTRKEYFCHVLDYPYAMAREHTTPQSCMVVIDGKVYDVTAFLAEHPGGDRILLDYAGARDASVVFGLSFHSEAALALMEQYLAWDPHTYLGRRGTLVSVLSEYHRGASAKGGGIRRQKAERRSARQRQVLLRFGTVEDATEVLSSSWCPRVVIVALNAVWAIINTPRTNIIPPGVAAAAAADQY